MIFLDKPHRIFLVAVALCVVFILLGAASITTWEYTNSNAFCADACHNVHPEETYAHAASQHTKVKCIECHLGRLPTFKMIAVKATHVSQLWGMLTGYDRPLTAHLPPTQHSCQSCHSTQPHQNDSIHTRVHYKSDQSNTETRTQLSMRTTAGATWNDGGRGIRWHTSKQVRFIATDAQNLNIPWVEVTKDDGRTVIYRDVTQGRLEGESFITKKHVMGCTDCHNRVGHPFRNPEVVVDNALAKGQLNHQLPFLKARLLEILNQDFTTQENALHQAEAVWERYLSDFPNIPEDFPKDWVKTKQFLTERQQLMMQLVSRKKFLEPGISWQSFYDHMGHKDFPGCFRCHSGKHLNSEGDPIPVNCTLCHQIPVVIYEGKRAENAVPPFGVPKPDTHRIPTFLYDHRALSMEDESCAACHGEIRFGDENESFCSNSACHGAVWPNLSLDRD